MRVRAAPAKAPRRIDVYLDTTGGCCQVYIFHENMGPEHDFLCVFMRLDKAVVRVLRPSHVATGRARCGRADAHSCSLVATGGLAGPSAAPCRTLERLTPAGEEHGHKRVLVCRFDRQA